MHSGKLPCTAGSLRVRGPIVFGVPLCVTPMFLHCKLEHIIKIVVKNSSIFLYLLINLTAFYSAKLGFCPKL